MNGDFSSEPETLKLAATEYPDQMQITPSGGLRYVAMNTQKPPFDDLNVRKAVVAGADREAMIATRGGPLSGTVGTHYIPPGVPGFEEAGGTAGPDLDFLKNPKGDMSLAESYMKKAGFASGKCEGNCDVSMVSDNSPPGSNTSQVVKDELTQLGFNVNLQPVNHDVMYTKFCDVPKNTPNVCPNVAWGKDFNDAQSLLDPTFNGERDRPVEQLELAAAERQGGQHRARQGADRSRSAAAGADVREDRRSDLGARAVDPVDLGQLRQHRVEQRRRSDQPVQRELGRQLHVVGQPVGR